MRRPRFPLLLAVALGVLLGACTLGESVAPAVDAGRDAGPGAGVTVPEVSGIVWQREVGDLPVVGVTIAADPLELSLIGAALDQVPTAIRDKAAVRQLVRAVEAEALDPATLAFSRGPDIYLIDRTFEGTTRLELAYTLAHELAHVAQYASLDHEFVDGAIESLDFNRASLDVQDFIEAIGWIDGPDGWYSESAPSGTTAYGATGPSEDMAESVALVATGRAGELSADRVAWVEGWAGTSARDMAQGKPWRPPGAAVIGSSNPIYDEAAVAALGGSRREPLYLLLADDGAATASLVDIIGRELRSRGMAGVLEPIADTTAPRFGGLMVPADGSRLWVELWDFREATVTGSPDGAVLTYVDVWG
jgi:hypothetical protein